MGILQSLFAMGSITTTASDAGQWSTSAGQAKRTLSGEPVSPGSALSLSTYFACLRAISEDTAGMPIYLYGKDGAGRLKLVEGHPAQRLMQSSPNGEMAAHSWRESLAGNAMGWGNGYAEIQRAANGKPIALWPIHPSRVVMRRIDGRLVYDVFFKSGTVRLEQRDCFHVHGYSEDGLTGISIARMGAESIGLSLAAQDYGASFFGNGANPGLVLIHPGRLSEQGQKALRNSWMKQYGGPENAHKPAVVVEGIKVERTSIPPNDAQFLETRQFQVEEICRWFRCPPHIVQHLMRATNSNIEHQGLEYVQHTLTPWATRIEREAERKLLDPSEQEKYSFRHDFRELMRGDGAARSNYYRTMISTGVMMPNEAREMERLNTVDIPAANQLFLQGAMATLDRIASQPAPAIPQDNNPSKNEGNIAP